MKATSSVSKNTASGSVSGSRSKGSVNNTSSVRGSSVSKSGRSAQAHNEALRRAQEMRTEVESAVHVLDNGINRTPVQLQRKSAHNAGVGRGGAQGRQESLMASSTANYTMSNSIFRSSFLLSSEQGSSSKGFKTSGGGGESLENSVSMSQASFAGGGTTSSVGNTAGGAGSALTSKLVQKLQILDEAVVEPRAPFTDPQRRAWAQQMTTVTLCETPTIFLYEHQDEAVSSENREDLRRATARNAAYTALEEASRVDEGTQFQTKGTLTFTAPKKSIHAEMRPADKCDSGALQVTPWMLHDEFQPLLEEDAEEEAEAAKDAADGADGEDGKGGDGVDGDDGDGELDEDGDMNEDELAGSRSSFGESSVRPGESGAVEGGGVPAAASSSSSKKWIFADSLLSNLRVMERAVVQNFMEKAQLAYRGIDMDPVCERAGHGDADDRNTAAAPPRSRHEEDIAMENASAAALAAAQAEDAATAQSTAEVPPVELSAPSLQALWCYRAPQTSGRRVTAMTWNRKEPDILAVGYSVRSEKRGAAPEAEQGGVDRSDRGLVCCWSLKNPLAPELVLPLHAETSVSALSFSVEHPSLLAVGCTDGSIVVYDIQRDIVAPSILPNVSTGVHTGAVWELRWVVRGKDRGEFLMSVSADGRVVQWAVSKSVERLAPDLMHLKRPPNEKTETTFVEGVAESDAAAGRRRDGAAREEAILSQQSGGMCFDISPLDDAVYIVGTEEGCVYQCNKSQTETYDVAYEPHTELVYHIRWSPFHPYYFLTCSVDWTSRLYRVGQSAKVLTFDSVNQDAVQDIAWSYANALVFATATAQGCVEVWSVSDVVYPQAHIQYKDHRRLSCVVFAEQESPVLVVGDEEGDVTVFLLKDSRFQRPEMDEDEQVQWLDDAVRKQTA